ncbi:deoxyribose-phosphate aldolase [Kurthia zopfii]|uniref:Deoxyribose-phosphate aldolase n=1 Tax=Kurthia zopfii TaxID=1650 RepID=A0A8B4QBJ6_9BACL|nr:deoxyribose-phosphate aldolase [Kurthia zopfii]PWI24076.1 deoxyribose-phosphate aldolase [Kurthia zopfii]TDR44332.1 deoxyribose-phosphate aldolase [Kurthia zopfii]GEK29712.1 deoxyribose-phosphate aldolase [Kurthia zopfii]STX10062.1 Deoxyribose-phosphate aldolase 2 [Kurthia zopfii]
MTTNIASLIDHTLLKPEATADQVEQICAEAKKYNFASVCVNPAFVELAAKELQGAESKVCTVIGFPLGASTSATKAFETKDAIEKGATEIDMVMNIGAMKAGQFDVVLNDMKAVREAAGQTLVKVILETCLLTDSEKEKACELAVEAKLDFVKTSTGFSTGGATVADVALMRRVVGAGLGVKASGGVRSLEDLEAMVAAGANRIGASSGVKIMNGLTSDSEY